ncbi:MAG: Beta-lactamase superfamily domain [Verrucomicrobiota bacterium]|jgi:L-ascorbate metabolism protein UlaG (beta-lactamase superfamily)
MKVTWGGHSCIFLQPARHRLLIDPGEFSAPADAAPLDQLTCDFALLAHGHDDHSGL